MNTVATTNSLVSAGAVSFASSAAINALNVLVVFDSRLSDLAVLYGALLPNAIGHTIDTTEDALVVITRLLAETGAKSLAIVAHGEPGIIHLGRESIDLGVLGARSGLFQEWCLDEISLYSCEVGASAEFVGQLAVVTGATVAASSTKVGANLLGGNWHLDVATRETVYPFDAQQIATYVHVLALIGSNSFYQANTSTFQNIDLAPGGSGVSSILTDDDDEAVQISLGANFFNFYGTSYSTLNISSNGRIYFGSLLDSELSVNDPLTTSADSIAVFLDDLATNRNTDDQVLYRIQNNQLIVEWNAVLFYEFNPPLTNPITFQAILQLNTGANLGNIDFNYVDTVGLTGHDNGLSATVGIRRVAGDPLLISFNNLSPFVGNGKAISITQATNSITQATNQLEDSDPLVLTIDSLFLSEFASTGQDQSTFFGVAITGVASNATEGNWEWFDGSAWNQITGVASTNALVLNASTQVRFLPALDYNGTPGGLTARVVNTSTTLSSGTSGVNVTGVGSGGSTGVSTASFSASTIITAVNDAPTLALNASNQSYTEAGPATNSIFFNAVASTNIHANLTESAQKIESITLTIVNAFLGDQLRVDGTFVDVGATTSSPISAGTFAVSSTVTGNTATVVIARPGFDITSADLQNLIGAIAYKSTSNNPTNFGASPTRTISVSSIKDNGGVLNGGVDTTALNLPAATITIATVNTPVVAVNDIRTGANAAVEGSVPVLATGNALTNDIDPDSILSVTKVGSTTVAPSGTTAIMGTYGTLTIGANGAYSYAADNTNTLVNRLNVGSPSLTDTFTYTVTDGPSSSTATIKIDIKGGNNAASITGAISGTINESIVTTAGTTVTGTLASVDVDNSNDWRASSGSTTHGSYGIVTGGGWTFTLDNGNSAVDALNVGSSFVDTFSVQTFDGTSQTVSVTIQGENDPAVIGGIKTGSIDESGIVVVSSTITGTLTATDVDSATNWSDAGSGSSSYGSYAITSAGLWTYTLNNSNSAVNSLNAGQTITDTFTVKTADGTTQAVAITINGKNDQATIFVNGTTYNLNSTDLGWYNNSGSHTPSITNTLTGGSNLKRDTYPTVSRY
jgi:VCBS repeat-containing protein